MPRSHSTILVLLLLAFAARPAHADWPGESYLNLPVCLEHGDQVFPSVASDGFGGLLVAWSDKRGGVDFDIYVQRINPAGNTMWTVHGAPVCVATGDQLFVHLAPDFGGGAYLAWDDRRSGFRVFAQHINALGNPTWAVNGIDVGSGTNSQGQASIAVDGSGGPMVAFYSGEGGLPKIRVQRLATNGTKLWGTGSLLGTSLTSPPAPTRLISDGAGGGYVAWCGTDVRLARFGPTGAPLWTSDLVLNANANYEPPGLALGSSGSALVAWSTPRPGTAKDVLAQRVTPAGQPMWVAGGVIVCGAALDQAEVVLTGDGSGGAVIGWRDERAAGIPDVYAQRLAADGSPQWTAGGTVVCNAAGSQYNPAIVPDGMGGAIFAWADYRVVSSGQDLYAQHIVGNGAPMWASNGVALRDVGGDVGWQSGIPDGSGGAFFAWNDSRRLRESDIYAQNVNADGSLGPLVPVPILPSLADAVETAEGVRVTGFASSDDPVGIERRRADTVLWQDVATVRPTGSGWFAWDDPDVEPGRTYAYRACRTGKECSTEITVTTAAHRLRLIEVGNPADGTIDLAFELGDGEPAELNLVDVRGRIVARQGLARVSGPQRLSWNPGELRSGRYFLRLVQSGHAETRSMIFLR